MAASFETILDIGGKKHTLNRCSYRFFQPTDHMGRAKAGVRSGLIEFAILGNNHDTLTHWAIDPFKMFDGKITHKDLINGTMKTVEFYKAYCVSYQETLIPSTSSIAYEFELGISAAQIKYNDVLHDNQWSDLKLSY